ncbi:hypothetical protein ACCUM_2618 [Candidatus Accumulibacter phosphatis]|uniref:Uncharacterized protein n=1 Tax=Candidatus Accumulibacter phosphatis TaxID=327160 RepID=A0A5S4EQZ4_9PROT|nr:hypothetical protein ACCUM_2618 [Candidatus Accumulibacter phosphatis]
MALLFWQHLVDLRSIHLIWLPAIARTHCVPQGRQRGTRPKKQE